MRKSKNMVFASTNVGKIKEFKAIMESSGGSSQFNLNVQNQKELAIPPCEEHGPTFVENALIKARHVCEQSNLPAIADDSGLMVDALNGAPGVLSARYAFPAHSSEDNIAKLLDALKDIPDAQRTARFYCVVVYLRGARDPAPLICQGVWEGKILTAPRGDNGFGYDPVFWVPTHNCSAAELPEAIKNSISHRALALQKLFKNLHKVF